MSNFIRIDLDTTSRVELNLTGVNLGDTNIWMKTVPTQSYLLQPGSKVNAILLPNSHGLAASEVIELLQDNTQHDNYESGYFYVNGGKNLSAVEDTLSFDNTKINKKNDYRWENTKFDLNWIFLRGADVLYGGFSGIYSIPHNVQSKEVVISGSLNSSSTMMDYSVKWDTFTNDNDAGYGSVPTDGPYVFQVDYKNWNAVNVTGYLQDVACSNLSTPIYFSDTTMSSGIYFSVPFNDSRETANKIPAVYNIRIGNVGVSDGDNKYSSDTLSKN
jgi:hypothetical protein